MEHTFRVAGRGDSRCLASFFTIRSPALNLSLIHLNALNFVGHGKMRYFILFALVATAASVSARILPALLVDRVDAVTITTDAEHTATYLRPNPVTFLPELSSSRLIPRTKRQVARAHALLWRQARFRRQPHRQQQLHRNTSAARPSHFSTPHNCIRPSHPASDRPACRR